MGLQAFEKFAPTSCTFAVLPWLGAGSKKRMNFYRLTVKMPGLSVF